MGDSQIGPAEPVLSNIFILGLLFQALVCLTK